MSLTRRTLLVRGGATLGGLAGAGLLADELLRPDVVPAPSRAARGNRFLERGIALGLIEPGRSRFGGIGGEQDLLGPDGAPTNLELVRTSGTRWVRLWVDWAFCQLEPGADPASDVRPVTTVRPAYAPRDIVANLDRQVDAARRAGLEVILTSRKVPRWANGTLGHGERRIAVADRLTASGEPKVPELGLPTDLTPSGPWADWLRFLIRRYAGRVGFLEIVNEPNLELWPQLDPAGRPLIARRVAEMFATAQQVLEEVHGAAARPPLVLVGPASSDASALRGARSKTDWATFTDELLAALKERSFRPRGTFAWSVHNYVDVEQGLTGRDHRVHAVREKLRAHGEWDGWPDRDPARPRVLVTEGGARHDLIAPRAAESRDEAQARLLREAHARLVDGPEGEGVALMTNFLLYTDPLNDSGLCDADGSARPALATWRTLPA